MTFPSTCGACGVRCETRMYDTRILFFYPYWLLWIALYVTVIVSNQVQESRHLIKYIHMHYLVQIDKLASLLVLDALFWFFYHGI